MLQSLLSQGLSLIPVRDKEEGGKPAKTPYFGWKEQQKTRLTEQELTFQLHQKKTQAIAIICGEVSGNLHVIDIDEKHFAGISILVFDAIKQYDQDLFNRLSIVRTPSGGHHLRYKIDGQKAPGNQKLAYAAEGKEAIIETRGEGGIVLCPPSAGYTLVQNEIIPTISVVEHVSLVNICKLLNQRKVTAPAPKATRYQGAKNYSVNPFEDFGQSDEAQYVLEEFGWKRIKSTKHHTYYTRPGKSDGISASYIHEKGLYFIFTSSTELTPSKAYHPATLLKQLRFKNDGKETYRYLVSKGYGKLDKQYERTQAAKLAKQNKPLPANFSQEAKQIATEIKTETEEKYPFGIFWKLNQRGEMKVSRQRLIEVAQGLGFRYMGGDVVRIDGFVLHRIDEREFQDALKSYIKEEEAEEYEEVCDAYESFMQKSGKFTMQRLLALDRSQIVKDTAHVAYKFYNNGFLHINKDRVAFNSYEGFEGLIFKERIQDRDYKYFEGGKYLEYLSLATNWTTQREHVQKCLGYLTHEYKDETTGYIIVLSEECPDPMQGGGSGKNVFCNLLANATTYTNKNGAQAKFDEKFFQVWNGQRILGISDVPKSFDFGFLKEASTGSFTWKRLFKDEVEVKVEDAPKFIIQTNYSFEITDGGLKRRIIPIEFTDYFTRAGGIDKHFGCHFPNGWSEQDWNGFDTLIAESIMLWIRGGLKLSSTVLSQGGKEKQFEQTYGRVIVGLLDANLENWKAQGEVPTATLRNDIKNYYIENMIGVAYQPSMQKINKALAEKVQGYISSRNIRVNGIVTTVAYFEERAF